MRSLAPTFALAILCLLPTMLLAKPKTLENVPLVYTPTTVLGEKPAVNLTGMLKIKIQIGNFVDARSDKALIAENREDADKGKIRKVTTKDDVGAWVRSRLAADLGLYGFTVVEGDGDVVISGEIRRFFVIETNTYQADVGILVTVTGADGKERWQGMANGSAERFGRSYKLENYQESWSDGVFEAIYSLVSNADFRQALSQ